MSPIIVPSSTDGSGPSGTRTEPNDMPTLPGMDDTSPPSATPRSPSPTDRECQQCISFLTRALDRSGSRPQSLLRALGVIPHGAVHGKEHGVSGDQNYWYKPSLDRRGVVISLRRQAAAEATASPPQTKQNTNTSEDDEIFLGFEGLPLPDAGAVNVSVELVPNDTQQTSIPSDVTTSLRRRLTDAATRLVGGVQNSLSYYGADDVLTTSPALDPRLGSDRVQAQIHDSEPPVTIITIECQPCGSDTRAEAGARAYVRGPEPLSVVLCSNRLSSQREVEEVLVHELVHVYGKSSGTSSCT